jgi:lycopene cyclase domain-containing protein
MPYAYLLINFLTVFLPVLLSFDRRLRFNLIFAQSLTAITLTALPFLIWDVWFTARGIWGFNPYYLTGAALAGLPVEEVLFFFCIPYACLFTYMLVKCMKDQICERQANYITWVLIGGALTGMYLFQDKAYTSLNFFVLAMILLVHVRFIRARYLGAVYLAFAILLVPFFLINGMLTNGLGHGPIVWYDNTENLGVRLNGIPIEDVFYALSLLLVNVTFMEWLLARRRRRLNIAVPEA